MGKRFHLVITETLPNENFAQEEAKWKELMRYGNFTTNVGGESGCPRRERTVKVLEVTVTETEFYAIKKAALETMA